MIQICNAILRARSLRKNRIIPHNNRTNEVNKRFIICHFLDSMHANSVIKGERHALLSRTHRIRTTTKF